MLNTMLTSFGEWFGEWNKQIRKMDTKQMFLEHLILHTIQDVFSAAVVLDIKLM